MTKNKITPTDADWIAVHKGDKDKARELMQTMAVSLLFGHEMSRSERLRLGFALIRFDGDPVAFFGHGRKGPSASKVAEQLEVWDAVKQRKKAFREEGKGQLDVYEDVAKKLNMKERTVRDWYEEIEAHVKKYEREESSFTQGITSLIP